jgi:hypothetical protein
MEFPPPEMILKEIVGGKLDVCTGIFDAQGTGHKIRISGQTEEVKHSMPDPERFLLPS